MQYLQDSEWVEQPGLGQEVWVAMVVERWLVELVVLRLELGWAETVG